MSHLSPIYADPYDSLYPDEDTSGLLAWTDDEGCFFCHDDDGRVVELRDGDPFPAHIAGQEQPNERANRLIGYAINLFVAAAALMFIAQFVRAWLAGRL